MHQKESVYPGASLFKLLFKSSKSIFQKSISDTMFHLTSFYWSLHTKEMQIQPLWYTRTKHNAKAKATSLAGGVQNYALEDWWRSKKSKQFTEILGVPAKKQTMTFLYERVTKAVQDIDVIVVYVSRVWKAWLCMNGCSLVFLRLYRIEIVLAFTFIGCEWSTAVRWFLHEVLSHQSS